MAGSPRRGLLIPRTKLPRETPEHRAPLEANPLALERDEAERLLIDNLGLLDRVVRNIARRYRLPHDEAEELLSAICLKLIANDYEVLRRFQRRSSLRTYLLVVVQRHLLDTRTARWGKWRPHQAALTRGPIAIALDRLITRDGLTFDQACEVLRTNHGVTATIGELRAMAAFLPERQARRFVSEQELSRVVSDAPGPDDLLSASADRDCRDHVREALRRILADLPDEERLLLTLRFRDGHTVAAMSQRLQLEQKPLYRRLALVLKRLRGDLEAVGVTREQVLALLGHAASDLADVLPAGPSPIEHARPPAPRAGAALSRVVPAMGASAL